MSRRDDDDFRPKLGPPRAKGRGGILRLGKRAARPLRFTTRVLKAAAKSSGSGRTGFKKHTSRPGAQYGRGQVASRLAQKNLGPRARRVIIKTRLVVMADASPTSTQDYLRYIQRDGVSRDGEPGHLYSADLDAVDREAFESRIRDDRHQFRFIVSPEDGQPIGDLRSYTRDLMARMERDLGTKLDWVAVDHWDTDDPHTHILLRGKDEYGADLVIAREYIAHGMRARAREVATDWLGPRTEIEIRASLAREVTRERWTSLDETIQHYAFRDVGEKPTERPPMQTTSAREQPPVDVDRITNPDQPVTLYRGENEQNASNGEWWTTNRDKAAKYGHVQALTLPARDIAMHSVRGHGGPDERVFPGRRPPELAPTATETSARAAGPASDFLSEFQGRIDLRRETQGKRLDFHKSLQAGRLQHLEKMGLAQELKPGVWSVHRDFATTLRTMGERGDIIRTMQRTFTRERRDFAIFDPSRSPVVVGRVVSKGLVDELHDRAYLIVDGLDGRAHHVTLPARFKLTDFAVGAVIEVGSDRKPAKPIATSSTFPRTDCIGSPIIWPPRVSANATPRALFKPMCADSKPCAEHRSWSGWKRGCGVCRRIFPHAGKPMMHSASRTVASSCAPTAPWRSSGGQSGRPGWTAS